MREIKDTENRRPLPDAEADGIIEGRNAVIEALRCLKRPCDIDIYTDSQYVQKGISEWITGWKARGWRTASKAPVKNADLWQMLDAEVARHRIQWHWVKGHAGHEFNERADELANRGVELVR